MSEDARGGRPPRAGDIHEAFVRGDLDALRAALPDPAVVPRGELPAGLGNCLVYAIYHSPIAFVRRLLDLGADPNADSDDGFPPVIAALTTSTGAAGAPSRDDVDSVLRLLLSRGADPNQRGVNDWTPLHVAVSLRHLVAIYRLLAHGADPTLRTRIDDGDTPIEMAARTGQQDAVRLLSTHGRWRPQRLRSGLQLLVDVPGQGARVARQEQHRLRLRMWLQDGHPVVWQSASGVVGESWLEDAGMTLVTTIMVNRGHLMNGLFYGLDGMGIGGLRLLEIAPHLAYGERGVPATIPPGARLTAEVTVLA